MIYFHLLLAQILVICVVIYPSHFPKLCMQTGPQDPGLCLSLHSASSDLWQNFLGFTRILYWSFLLQLIYKKDDEHRGWMLGGLISLLRTLCSALGSPTLLCQANHQGWHFVVSHVKDSHTFLQGLVLKGWLRVDLPLLTIDHGEDAQHQIIVRHLTCRYLQLHEMNLTLCIHSPSILGRGIIPSFIFFYLVINLVATQGSLSIFT